MIGLCMRRGVLAGFLLAGLVALSTQSSTGEALVYGSAQAVQPLLVGTKIPTGTLRTSSGAAVDLAAMVAAKPTVLVFYRGSW